MPVDYFERACNSESRLRVTDRLVFATSLHTLLTYRQR